LYMMLRAQTCVVLWSGCGAIVAANERVAEAAVYAPARTREREKQNRKRETSHAARELCWALAERNGGRAARGSADADRGVDVAAGRGDRASRGALLRGRRLLVGLLLLVVGLALLHLGVRRRVHRRALLLLLRGGRGAAKDARLEVLLLVLRGVVKASREGGVALLALVGLGRSGRGRGGTLLLGGRSRSRSTTAVAAKVHAGVRVADNGRHVRLTAGTGEDTRARASLLSKRRMIRKVTAS